MTRLLSYEELQDRIASNSPVVYMINPGSREKGPIDWIPLEKDHVFYDQFIYADYQPPEEKYVPLSEEMGKELIWLIFTGGHSCNFKERLEEWIEKVKDMESA